MIGRIIDISTSSTRLSVAHNQLVIERKGEETTTVPIEDIGLLLLNSPSITMSQAVATRLAEYKAAIIFCGKQHMPISLSLPLEGHTVQGERLRQQMALSTPLRKRLWQKIVSCKIERQADVLELVTGDHKGLRAMAKRVQSGDKTNLEAQAAQRYWPCLFDKSFRRARFGARPNTLLNYGYAVFRSALARNIVMSGLHPGIGLFHAHRANSFPLADDLIEVWRPYVDLYVKNSFDTEEKESITQEERRGILALFNESVPFNAQSLPMQMAMQHMVATLAKAFEEKEHKYFLLPEGFI